VLVGQPQTEDGPGGQPPAGLAGPADPYRHQGQRRPGQHIGRGRARLVPGGQQDRHRGGRGRGQQLRAAAPAKLTRGQAADHHGARGGQRGPQPQPRQPHTEQLQRHPRQQRRQHRLIDITTLQVPGAIRHARGGAAGGEVQRPGDRLREVDLVDGGGDLVLVVRVAYWPLASRGPA
jgi:hypothetical protein